MRDGRDTDFVEPPDERNDLCAAFNFHPVNPALFDHADDAFDALLDGRLESPERHIRKDERGLGASCDGFAVVYKLVEGEGCGFGMAESDLRERITHKDHVNTACLGK